MNNLQSKMEIHNLSKIIQYKIVSKNLKYPNNLCKKISNKT